MNVSELQRKLLYCGYDDIADYLRDSPLHRYIYKRFLTFQSDYGIKTNLLGIFNELYYQLVHIQTDRTPGIDVEKRFLKECEQWLGSSQDAMLVFVMVKAIYELKRNLTFEEDCFWDRFSPLIAVNRFQAFYSEFSRALNKYDYRVPERFEIMHVPLRELQAIRVMHDPTDRFIARFFVKKGSFLSSDDYVNAMAIITDDFSPKGIMWLIHLYRYKEDRKVLLQCIEVACPEYWQRKKKLDFVSMMQEIEEDERMFPAGYEQTVADAENDKAEQYKQERENLKFQFEQLKKNYETDVARLEAKYQQEIEKLKTELAQRSKEQGRSEVQEEKKPQELAFTITEIVDDAKNWFHELGASELTNMLYRLTIDHHYMEDDVWTLIKTVIPAVENRLKAHTQIDVATVHQMNVNPQQVINHIKEDKASSHTLGSL